jgi:hypothetical protein
MFYLLKHTIEGTKEETFSDQAECDPVIEDLEVTLNSLREELHLYAQKRGDMVGPITLIDSGDEIDCTRMGSGGYGIPSIVEPERIEIRSTWEDLEPNDYSLEQSEIRSTWEGIERNDYSEVRLIEQIRFRFLDVFFWSGLPIIAGGSRMADCRTLGERQTCSI